VLELSSGSPFWCKSISNYITDYGSNTFLESVSGTKTKDSLLFLIICRVEKLRPEQQNTIKYASIIGSVFPLRVLSQLLPVKLRENLTQCLDILEDHRFIIKRDDSERQEITYMFHSRLLQKTIYDLTPKSTAKDLHNSIAQIFEEIYGDKMSKYSAAIGHHYCQGEEEFSKAFKFSIQAAQFLLKRRNFQECLKYALLLKELMTTPEEYDSLVSYVTDATKLLNRSSTSSRGSFGGSFSMSFSLSVSPLSDSVDLDDIQHGFKTLSLALLFDKKNWNRGYEQQSATITTSTSSGDELDMRQKFLHISSHKKDEVPECDEGPSSFVTKEKPTTQSQAVGTLRTLGCVMC
jgi:hypothetical protein